MPDYQLSLAIGKEGQNARLAARLTGWRVDIKSETQLAEEEAGGWGTAEADEVEYAEGEWLPNPETGEVEWHSAEGGVVTQEQWAAEEATGEPVVLEAVDEVVVTPEGNVAEVVDEVVVTPEGNVAEVVDEVVVTPAGDVVEIVVVDEIVETPEGDVVEVVVVDEIVETPEGDVVEVVVVDEIVETPEGDVVEVVAVEP